MMDIRYLKIIIVTFIVIFMSTPSRSEIKVAFVEMDTIIQKSDVGKSLIKQLKSLDNNNQKFYLENKKKLDLKKNKITTKKNILSTEQFNKKVLDLNNEFQSFKNETQKKILP